MFCTKCKDDYVLLNKEAFNNHFPKPDTDPRTQRERLGNPWQQNSRRKTAAFLNYTLQIETVFQCSQRYFVLYFWNIKDFKYSTLNSVFHE